MVIASTGESIVMQCILWLTTVGVLTIFDTIAKKRLGVTHQAYSNLRFPKFLALIISSITAIVSLFLLKVNVFDESVISYFSVPYFAAISYFLSAFFREIKNVNVSK